jgi:hypothetical protein
MARDPVTEYGGPEPDDGVSIDDPIEMDDGSPLAGWTFGAAPRQADEDAAGAELVSQVCQWAREGRRTFGAADLAPLRAELGISRPALFEVLGELEDEGVITRQDGGTWQLQPREPWHLANEPGGRRRTPGPAGRRSPVSIRCQRGGQGVSQRARPRQNGT